MLNSTHCHDRGSCLESMYEEIIGLEGRKHRGKKKIPCMQTRQFFLHKYRTRVLSAKLTGLWHSQIGVSCEAQGYNNSKE